MKSLEELLDTFFADPWEDVDPSIQRSWRNRPDHRSAMLSYSLTLAAFAARAAEFGDIVEVGTFCGSGALALAWGARITDQVIMSKRLVRSLDTDISRIGPSRRRLERCGFDNDVHVLYSDTTSYSAIVDMPTLGLAFIDADHSHLGCLNDLCNLRDCLAPCGYFLLHDYHPPGEADSPYTAVAQFLSENPGWQVSYLGSSFALVARVGQA